MNEGWRCPGCGRCWSPSVRACACGTFGHASTLTTTVMVPGTLVYGPGRCGVWSERDQADLKLLDAAGPIRSTASPALAGEGKVSA